MTNILQIYVSQTSSIHKSYLHGELTITLFLVENRNNKNENNSPQSYRRRMHLGRNITYNRVSQSLFYQVLNAVSDGGFKRKCSAKHMYTGFEKHMWTSAFLDMNAYIHTEGGNFKTFLKEKSVIALNSCYLFTYKMELSMMSW